MQYSKIQKYISSLVLFSMLFGLTFRIPFFDYKAYAGNSDYYNLVSIIVDEDTYDDISSEVKRYASDIQGVLENTKVIIIPTPIDTPAFNIASLNEGLYFNGYKSIKSDIGFESKLIGTVLVGKFNLPVVFDGKKSSKTILPFTDFEDKVYLYDHKANKYIKNKNNINGLKSEIWHGVISPNLGNNKKNIIGLKEYFDKNHDFYKGTGNFKLSDGILNGNVKSGVGGNYKPFVFYYDQFREEKALNYTLYKGYEAYLNNKEDIVYNRFTKELADKISDTVLGEVNDNIGGMMGSLSKKIDSLGNNSPFSGISNKTKSLLGKKIDTKKSPDIQTRFITENMTKKFLEIFAKGIIGDFRSNVHNAGRYNGTGGEVNVDLIPYLITVLDLVNDGIIKDVNTEIENKIDDLVKGGLSRNIAIPQYIKEYKLYNYNNGTGIDNYYDSSCYDLDVNYLYGNNVKDIKTAVDCSIYRGNTASGGKLVEANRGLNINLSLSDKDKINTKYCLKNLSSGKSLRGLWGGNSPLNIDRNNLGGGELQLATHNVDASIEPLFNIGGSKRSIDKLKNPSPLDCFNNNLLSDTRKEWSKWSFYEGSTCETKFKTKGKGWSCTYNNIAYKNSFNTRFEDFYKNSTRTSINDINKTYCATTDERGLITEFKNNGNSFNINKYYTKKKYTLDESLDYSCKKSGLYKQYNFKFIPSYIIHKSPTPNEIKGEIKTQITSDLPIDKNRYIDFIGAKGNLLKLNYPALFRINVGDKTKITLSSVSASLEAELRKKSIEINKIINDNNPLSLSGKDLELYNILKVKNGSYPKNDFDLLKFLKDKPAKTFNIGNEKKTISYYDTLVFAIYWNNLSSVSAKYGAIFDNYLNDSSAEDSKYFLPKNKKEYEIAYLGAKGDAQNMYIKMDPKSKGKNPYSSILSDNLKLSSVLLGTNIGNGGSLPSNSLFKCAPPDGVPIWEWIPAVMCRLGNMMPPSISLSDSACGPSILDLMSDKEKKELNQCNGDFNKNGINDCIENKLGNGGILELISDSKKYFYNKNAKLKAIFKDKNGKIVTVLNNSKVKFQIVKIEIAKNLNKDLSNTNKEIVYDLNNPYKNDKSIISQYVTFKDLSVNITGGKAEYGIGLKGKDANIYLRATLSLDNSNNKKIIFLNSNNLLIKIRGDRLFSSTYKLTNNKSLSVEGGINTLTVSDKINIFIADKRSGGINSLKKLINNASLAKEKSLIILDNISTNGKSIKIDYPLNIKIKDSKDNLIKEYNFNSNDLKYFKGLIGIKKAGSYKVEIKDSKGFTTLRNIELIHDVPYTVDTKIGTTIMEKGGNISTNFFTIYDKFKNVITGDFINYKISIDGKGIVFLDNGLDVYKGTTFEGYKVFRLKSTNITGNNKLNITIYDNNGKEIIKAVNNIRVADKINFDVVLLNKKDIKVGNNKYKYKISLKDSNGNILKDFNSRIYLNGNPLYVKTPEKYELVKNGSAEIEFETKTVAGKNINLEFQILGLNNILKKEITILPESPIKVDLIMSKNKIEASTNASSILKVELKDRYNNVVFNDNSTKTSIEILDKYSSIITSNKKISNVKEGVSNYRLSGTLNPGVAYFKINTIPSLSKNQFFIKDKKGLLRVKGVGENAAKIETFYFWNKNKIKNKKYNSLYTTLLGSNYGDIDQKNYLAGSLLFDKNNKSLAVTSLLNNPSNYENIINLNNNGKINIIDSSSDLMQNISVSTDFIANKLAFNLYNESLNTYIGKIYYNFGNKTTLVSCDSDLFNCIEKNNTTIALKSLSINYNVYLSDDKLIFRNINGKTLFTIDKEGKINKKGIVSFSFNEKNKKDYLSVNIKSGANIIGEIGISLVNTKIINTRNETLFKNYTKSLKNSILVLLKSDSYGVNKIGNGYNKGLNIYYNDPFKTNKGLNKFSKDNSYGYENFINKGGIGWKEGNKSLLEFAAGKNVGESVKDFMSFSVINLGDPVISLKKITKKIVGTKKDRKFDSTIGKLISDDDNILDYQVFDYNNDNKKDILLIKKDRYFKLLENKNVEENFINKGNLAFIVDLGASDLVKTGDFTGDGYDDIFFVNNKGKPFLLNNVIKNFTRYSLVNDFKLDGKIVRVESFDMDNDGKTDIITLDDSGKINIFYGGGISNKPSFTKLTVSKGNGIKLNNEIRNDNSLIYFDGLYKPDNNIANTNEFERYLFVKYPYSNNDEVINYNNVLSGKTELPKNKKTTYFLKTQYSEYSGIKVEKLFKDINGGYLSSGDLVDVTIRLKNISNKTISNIDFVEKVPNTFKLENNSLKIDGYENKKIIGGEVGYNFLINDINLNKGEDLIINYKAKVRPIQYSYMQVGLFEKGEVGDDKYGDIIIKKDNKNCSNTIKLFRSVNKRSYLLGTKVPNCNDVKASLPKELEKNTIDKDGNGIPDYIDKLSDPNNTDTIQKYAKEKLDIMNKDSDGDGLPNDEDSLDGSVLSTLFNGGSTTVNVGLGKGLDNIDKQLDGLQEVLNGLNCGNASCFASPLNWAPLAPGSDPIFMGKTIGDGLKVNEGLPIVSAMTGIPLYGPWGCIPIPMIWPISPIGLDTTCSSNTLGAGGWLGVNSATNFFRLFVTPTLTGGVGTAICFGGPASVAGNILPQGISPLLPGGNCIVIAKKMNFCNGDGSDGDPGSIGIPMYSGNSSFGIINGNCGTNKSSLDKEKENQKILERLLTLDNGKDVKKIFGYLPGKFSDEPITPLFKEGDNDAILTLDLSTDSDGNFGDIIKIQQPRISPFPSWLMGWVTRQIEEIANKLTDFPTIFIILPDFSGVFDSTWGQTSGNNNKLAKNTITSNNKFFDKKVEKVNSGIKEAYEFIGSLPLIYIKQETVNITIPGISNAEIDKTILLREATLKQWENEINRAKKEYSNDLLNGDNISGDANVDFDIDFLLDGLRKNLEVIKEYKTIPEKVNKLINLKQDYLEQILCNIEVISNILGGRIGKNGDRFKAWVEAYILIKAILKSWQLLVDVFVDYESECYNCKNERQDALDSEFKLIDMIVPKIPIITWPKWPDIIIDLHNIRAGLTVSLPEFSVNVKPIILPTLPNLYLPKLPQINIDANLSLSLADMLNLPKLPVLPELIIPDLPPIPSLPTINLPDLPPPPKLPKMFGSIDVVLDIIKLITKAMCMLKSLPITPEWRAGDQIAFLTERNGYLGTDFFDVSIPEFSFPFIDAIKVTTYVNLEFDTDFIIELAREIAMPINNFSNDYTNIFSNVLPDLDFRGLLPNEINLDVNIDTDAVKKLSRGDLSPINDQLKSNNQSIKKEFNNSNEKLNDSLDKIKKGFDESSYNNSLQLLLATKIGADFKHFAKIINKGKNDTVSNLEFKKIVNNALANKSVTTEPKMDKIVDLWKNVNNRNFSKENNIITELQNNNKAKFKVLTDIINTEIIKNKDLKKKLESIGNPIVRKVGYYDNNKIDLYNKKLNIFNNKFKDTAKKLLNYDDKKEKELKIMGNDLISSIKDPLKKYSQVMIDNKKKQLLSSINNNVVALNTSSIDDNTTSQTSCQKNQNSEYKRTYKGLYVLEENKSYRLFDYLDELTGNETTKIIDIDNDGDDDLLYFSAKKLYLKENLKIKDTKIHVNTNPIVINISDNKYLNGDIFYEAINNPHEIGSDNGSINIGFSAPTNNSLDKFRLGFYTIVDKYLNIKDIKYRPKFIKKDIIDAIADIGNITKIKETNFSIIRKNLVYIKNIGDLLGSKIISKELKNIATNISKGKIVNIKKGTVLYAGDNSFTIRYLNVDLGDKKEYSLNVKGYNNIEFKNNIKIIGIDGDAYVEGYSNIVYEGEDIRKLLHMPLFPGTIISYVGNNYKTIDSSYIELEYYDKSEVSLDFNYVSKWELYDLGLKTLDYNIRVSRNNDYYYAKINSFNKNINGTLSRQILFAPQTEADTNAPELKLSSIKIPVYQNYLLDLTNKIYEDSGIRNVKKIIIDFDLTKDTNHDGNSKNDDDININGEYKNQINILRNPAYLKLKFKPFNKLFKKKIGITLIDTNNNIGYGEVNLEVYSPVPHINSYEKGIVKGILIDEDLTKEPISLYRFRGGVINKLENINGKKISYTTNGSYRFNIKTKGTGLKLYDGGKREIAYINEKTGKITLKDHSITNKVLSSSSKENDSVFPKILLRKKGKNIFYEYLKMKGVNEVKFVNNFDNIKDKGIYFKFSDYSHYSYYKIPLGLDYNPGALSIYRNTSTNKEALFTIFNDGRINTINDNDFSIKYDFYGDNIVLKLYDKNNFGKREIGRVLFKSNSEYIMQ